MHHDSISVIGEFPFLDLLQYGVTVHFKQKIFIAQKLTCYIPIVCAVRIYHKDIARLAVATGRRR